MRLLWSVFLIFLPGQCSQCDPRDACYLGNAAAEDAESKDAALPLLQTAAGNRPASRERPLETQPEYRWLCGFEDAVNSTSEVTSNLALLEEILKTSCGFRAEGASKRFAYFKTHKTGSTTIAYSLFRSAIRKKQRWAACADFDFDDVYSKAACPWEMKANANVDYELRHVLSWDFEDGSSGSVAECVKGDGHWFEQVLEGYETLMGKDVEVFVSIREPSSYLKSILTYQETPLEEFQQKSQLWNPFAQEFRVMTQEQAALFSSAWPFNRSSRLHVLPLEDLSPAMVMLRRTLQWDLKDVVYGAFVHPSDANGGESKVSISAEDLQQLPREAVEMDEAVYDAMHGSFLAEYQLAKEDPSFAREVLAHQRIVSALDEVCALSGGWAVMNGSAESYFGDEYPMIKDACLEFDVDPHC